MKNKPKKILIIEDEISIREMIHFSLSESDFKVIEAENTLQAESILKDHLPDLILLDWMLPGQSGFEFVNYLKNNNFTKDIPLIMLTAKAEEENKVRGLERGVDDYITKPFSTRELIARIKTVLRRGTFVCSGDYVQFNDLFVNLNKQDIKINNHSLKLTPLEYRLLLFLIKNPNRIITREQFLIHVWKECHDVDDRTVDVQIRRLRKVLAPFNYHRYIQTIRSEGYLLLKE